MLVDLVRRVDGLELQHAPLALQKGLTLRCQLPLSGPISVAQAAGGQSAVERLEKHASGRGVNGIATWARRVVS